MCIVLIGTVVLYQRMNTIVVNIKSSISHHIIFILHSQRRIIYCHIAMQYHASISQLTSASVINMQVHYTVKLWIGSGWSVHFAHHFMLGMLAYCARPGDASMDTSRVSCVSHPLLILSAITVANRLLHISYCSLHLSYCSCLVGCCRCSLWVAARSYPSVSVPHVVHCGYRHIVRSCLVGCCRCSL